MKRRPIAGELFPDADAIRDSLERRTRDALLRRLGPQMSPASGPVSPGALSPGTRALDAEASDVALPNAGTRPDASTRSAVASSADPPLFAPDPAERLRARGIGFGVELVRAILAGRKTQTRRLVRPPSATPPSPADCPVARPGELLYVREPWRRAEGDHGPRTLYAADESHAGRQFRPAMYMPRAAARLWLRVRDVRAERLQSISPTDLAAEGLPPGQSLASVWDGFYVGRGERYSENPWVWVVSFTVK